jgi:signal transduction histidine kinase
MDLGDLGAVEGAGGRGSGRKLGRLKAALAAFSVFTVAGLIFAMELYIGFFGSRTEQPLRYYLIWTLGTAWSWLAVSPIIFRCARRWTFEQGRWWQSLAGHAATLLLVAPLQSLLDTVLSLLLYGESLPAIVTLAMTVSDTMFLSGLAGAPVPFVVIAGLVHGSRYYRQYREHELAAARLETALTEARLQALRAQINPHFLFNTLNSIGALSRRDPEGTNRMVTLLCALLRRSLDSDSRQVVSLGEEVGFAGDYLEIERVRFPDRLRVAFEVPRELLDWPVPSLILQPLVENAVRHGIAPRSSPGLVTVSARLSGTSLELTVEDDGVGLPPRAGEDGGLGLRITRDRLRLLYGGDAGLKITKPPGGGSRVTVTLPLGGGSGQSEGEETS